jgi:hypothetical protein
MPLNGPPPRTPLRMLSLKVPTPVLLLATWMAPPWRGTSLEGWVIGDN